MKQGLSICNLSSGYTKRLVIDNLTVPPLPRGKITVLLGPNGCGKSTLLRALAGLNRAKGELWLNGEALQALPFERRAERVVYLPQALPAGVHLHVLESILVARQASSGKPAAAAKREAMALLEQLGIASLALSFLDQLSGGQKQLVGLAQSLIRQPALLLLDEPLSALDLNYQFHVMELIARETHQRNIITIVVVHDINIALRHAGHVLLLLDGQLIDSGEAEQVITAENLARTYGVRSRIECCSRGIAQVFIDGLVKYPV